MTDQAARLVALSSFRWMPGMLDQWRRRILACKGGVPTVVFPPGLQLRGPMLPDLTDPATIGCLWALVADLSHSPSSWHTRHYNDAAHVAEARGPLHADAVKLLIDTLEAYSKVQP